MSNTDLAKDTSAKLRGSHQIRLPIRTSHILSYSPPPRQGYLAQCISTTQRGKFSPKGAPALHTQRPRKWSLHGNVSGVNSKDAEGNIEIDCLVVPYRQAQTRDNCLGNVCVDRDERRFVVLYVVEKCGNAAEFEEQVGGC